MASMRTPVNSSTMFGPETNAKASSVKSTTSASPSRSAGPETAAPVTIITTGTLAPHRATAAAARPQPCRAAMPSLTSAPAVERMATSGTRCSRANVAAMAMVSPSSLLRAPRWRDGSVRTTTAGRPPRSSTPADTTPGTRSRKGSTRAGVAQRQRLVVDVVAGAVVVVVVGPWVVVVVEGTVVDVVDVTATVDVGDVVVV